ncbi:hypothetical protein ACLPHM_14905 [Paenalcaligenes sp. Me131]|uniref:hypothetical protein n=1 Tax=Paenalcaligenes sp. Me131 TaxID=3392636 RepID=UPI003D2C6E4F
MSSDQDSVAAYIKAVSQCSGLGMSAQRQQAHVVEFQRLLKDANALCQVMGRDEHLGVGPIVVVQHDESALAAGGA